MSVHERKHEHLFRDSLDCLEAARAKVRTIERPVREDELRFIFSTFSPNDTETLKQRMEVFRRGQGALARYKEAGTLFVLCLACKVCNCGPCILQ